MSADRIVIDTPATVIVAAEVIARHRCEDVHATRWDQPTALRRVMEPCESCRSWGVHVTRSLSPYLAPQAPLPAAPDDSKLRDGLRRVLLECMKRRDTWAKSTRDGAVARAVAYQSIAGLLFRELDETRPGCTCDPNHTRADGFDPGCPLHDSRTGGEPRV